MIIDVDFQKRSFLVFCLIGVLCTGIDAGVFYALHSTMGYRLAMVCGFCISLGINYVLNMRYSFKVRPTTSNAFGFVMAHLFNIFVVRMSLMWLFIRFLGVSDGIAYVPTLLISVVSNFFVLRYIVNR